MKCSRSSVGGPGQKRGPSVRGGHIEGVEMSLLVLTSRAPPCAVSKEQDFRSLLEGGETYLLGTETILRFSTKDNEGEASQRRVNRAARETVCSPEKQQRHQTKGGGAVRR